MKGETAQEARAKLGLSHQEMARFMQVGLRTLFRWEAEGVPPGPARLVYQLVLNGELAYSPQASPGKRPGEGNS